MNQELSNELTPQVDAAPLLEALRHRRRMRQMTRAAICSCAVIAAGMMAFWPRPEPSEGPVSIAKTAPSPPAETSVKIISSEELLDTLKDQTVAFIRWPDGKEELLIK